LGQTVTTIRDTHFRGRTTDTQLLAECTKYEFMNRSEYYCGGFRCVFNFPFRGLFAQCGGILLFTICAWL